MVSAVRGVYASTRVPLVQGTASLQWPLVDGHDRLAAGYNSWLERDRLVLLDFDPDVIGIASQPFWLFWTTAEGKARSHAPDYFAHRGHHCKPSLTSGFYLRSRRQR